MYMDKSIREIHESLLKKEVTAEELIAESLKKSHDLQEECNVFVTILDDAKSEGITDDLLSGIPYGIKDNLSTKGILSTGSSNTLRDYVPFFTATCVDNLKKHGAVPVNKTVLDEFGMGGTGTTGHTGIVLNPWDHERMCAGSSAGSACAVAAGVYPYALGTDTGDSVRKPAAFCGVVGYKPTYGMISRYGLFPFASSLDHIGAITRSVEDAAIVVDAMKGQDEKDMTSWDSSKIDLIGNLNKDIKGKKACIIKELCDPESFSDLDESVKKHLDNFNEAIEKIKTLGIDVDVVSVDRKLLNAVKSAYDIISSAEATSNMSNLTGIIFGPRSEGKNYVEMMKKYRTENFSPLIKRRFIIGSYVLQAENKDRYFFNAQRARRLIVDKWNSLFEKYDVVILPVGTGPAKYFDDSKNVDEHKYRILEEHLIVGNFGGFPSITIPDGFVDGLPVALNITGKCYDDANVLNIANKIEGVLGFKGQTREGEN